MCIKNLLFLFKYNCRYFSKVIYMLIHGVSKIWCKGHMWPIKAFSLAHKMIFSLCHVWQWSTTFQFIVCVYPLTGISYYSEQQSLKKLNQTNYVVFHYVVMNSMFATWKMRIYCCVVKAVYLPYAVFYTNNSYNNSFLKKIQELK